MYVRVNLDYADIVYHKAENVAPLFYQENGNFYMKQIEQIQYGAARVITGAWKGTSREKLYKILGWESLNERRVMRKLCILHETIETKFPNHLYKTIEKQFIGPDSRRYGLDELEPIHGSSTYRLTFFPSTIRDWNRLDKEIREAKSKNIFKKRILNKIRPKKDAYFGIRDHNHIRYLTMLRVGLSPLRAHKFGHGFLDTSNGLCLLCNIKEDTEHFLLSCRSFILSRSTLLQKVSDTLGYNVSSIPKSRMVNILLFGKEGIPDSKNYLILSFVVDYIIKSKRLDTLGEGGGDLFSLN